MKRISYVCLLCLIIAVASSSAVSAQRAFKYDTNGMAKIESDIEDFKPFVQGLTSRVPQCSSLDSIRFMASPVVLLGDSLLNHIARIFDGFYALHPQQYIPIENISDNLDHIMDTKTLEKA